MNKMDANPPSTEGEAVDATGALGSRLSAARKNAGVGLRELARRISVSPGLISLIENGRSAPSVGTLYAIATELGISFDYLFRGGPLAADETKANESSIVRVQSAAQRPTVRLASGVRWERLTWTVRSDFEFLYVVYEVGSASCDQGTLLRHGGEEFAYLLQGELGLTIASENFRLGPNDSISFDAQTPHRIWNAGKEPALAIWVVLQRRNDNRARSVRSSLSAKTTQSV